MFIFSYISAISSIIFFISGICVLIRNTEKQATVLHFGLLLISIALWCFANFKGDTALTGDWQVFWSNIALIAAYFGSTFHVSFSYALVSARVWLKTLPYLLISFATVPLLILGIGSYHSPVILYTSPGTVELGSLALVYLPFFIVTAIHTVIILVRGFSNLSVVEKNRRLWVLSGLITMKVGAALFSIILPLFGIVAYYSATPLASYAVLFALTIAVTKYQFLDIRLIIQRGAIYAVLFVLFIFTSIVATSLATHIFTENHFWFNQVNIVFLVGLGLWALPRADAQLRRITNPWFFKNNYNHLQSVSELQKILQHEVTLKGISRRYLSAVQKILPHEHMALVSYIQNKIFYEDGTNSSLSKDQLLHIQEGFDQKTLSTHNYLWPHDQSGINFAPAHVSPVIFNNKTVALLLLGPKKTGEDHTVKDIHFITHISEQLSVALQKAELYDKQTRHSDILEGKIKERTKKIQTLQESQEKNMLDISHALQTPLTILNLESQSLPDKTRNAVQNTISRVSESIRELLTLTRLENNQKNQQAEDVNLSAMCELLEDYFVTLTEEKSIAFSSTLEEDCMVHGVYDQLEKVVVNLVENAVKYMPEQTDSHVHISLSKTPTETLLQVKDNGSGINTQDQERVFSRFFRSESVKDIPGTGLGLAICQEIIQQHGGDISIESEKGSTTFIVSIPLGEH